MNKAIVLSLFLAISCQATQYRATVSEVHDGDTAKVMVSLGLDVLKSEKIRIYGIDTPELITPEGKAVQRFLENLLKGKEIMIDTNEDRREKYGRLLCKVYLDGEDIGQLLVKKKMAKEYYGGKRT